MISLSYEELSEAEKDKNDGKYIVMKRSIICARDKRSPTPLALEVERISCWKMES
jgi:hypothetical protein